MNFYKVLEVDQQASNEVINKAYRALSLKYHPDRRGAGDEFTEERMRQINQAYAVLSDPAKRSAYDAGRLTWELWVSDGLVGLAKAWAKSFERGAT